MHILGANMHIHIKYKVFIINPVARRPVADENADTNADDNDNYALQTNDDYIGSFGIIPNDPTRVHQNYNYSDSRNVGVCPSNMKTGDFC